MFNIGDLIIYSTHGICKIDDICEKTVLGNTEKYYVLHPVENNSHLTISTPVNNDKVLMQSLIDRETAFKILESFKEKSMKWIDNPNTRHTKYSEIINTGNRSEITKVVNTLMRKELDLERNEKKLNQNDEKLLKYIQNILFKEIAIALDTTYEDIKEVVLKKIKENGYGYFSASH